MLFSTLIKLNLRVIDVCIYLFALEFFGVGGESANVRCSSLKV